MALIVNALLKAHSEALSDFLYHSLRYAPYLLAYCWLQVPWATFEHLCLQVTPHKYHTGLNQVNMQR